MGGNLTGFFAKNGKHANSFLALAALLIAGPGCVKTQFENILYTQKYISSNETGVLKVPPDFGAHIPQDSLGRPFRPFHMDLYEYPNDPVRPDDPDAADAGSFPLVNVNYYEAEELCEAAGKRLCSIYEWRMACLSDGTGLEKTESSNNSLLVYPYFDVYVDDNCATEKSSTAKSGSHPSCAITFGSKSVFDLSGNVWEWVDHDFYGQADQIGDSKAIVGGYYFSGPDADCLENLIVDTDHENDKTGFRCCRDAEVEE